MLVDPANLIKNMSLARREVVTEVHQLVTAAIATLHEHGVAQVVRVCVCVCSRARACVARCQAMCPFVQLCDLACARACVCARTCATHARMAATSTCYYALLARPPSKLHECEGVCLFACASENAVPSTEIFAWYTLQALSRDEQRDLDRLKGHGTKIMCWMRCCVGGLVCVFVIERILLLVNVFSY